MNQSNDTWDVLLQANPAQAASVAFQAAVNCAWHPGRKGSAHCDQVAGRLDSAIAALESKEPTASLSILIQLMRQARGQLAQ